MKIYSLILTLFLSSIITSCSFGPSIVGSDNIISKTYDFSDFNAIEISQVFHIELIHSETYRVEVLINDNIEPSLDVNQKGNKIEFGLDHSIFSSFSNVNATAKIYTPNIDEISMSGATKVDFKNFSTDHISIDMSGASEVKGELNVQNKLYVDGSGASNVNIRGFAKVGEFSFSGASKLINKDMIIEDHLIVDCSGASKTEITCHGNIELDLSGASHFVYYGNGNIISEDVSGAASIKKK